MEWAKYPLEKLVYFVAGIIPGFVTLAIWQLAAPSCYDWFFARGFLGYRTKLSLIILTSFVVGYGLATFLRASLGAIGGAYGTVAAQRPYEPPYLQKVAPWRDPRWRIALAKHLGEKRPNDSGPISTDIFQARQKMVEYLPQDQQASALCALNSERLNAEMDDLQWEQWYDHYHQIVLRPDDRDVFLYVRWSLNLNLETAALCVLLGALVVSRLRHWWYILPAFMWVLMLLAEEYSAWKQYPNRWSPLSAQIKYLSEMPPIRKGEA
jgi:hypothetical protein